MKNDEPDFIPGDLALMDLIWDEIKETLRATPERYASNRRLERYAAHHAPEGGVTIAGTFYDGGRFIPLGEVSKADPATQVQLGTAPTPGLSGDHHTDSLLKRGMFGHFDSIAEIRQHIAEVQAVHSPARLAQLMRTAGIEVAANANRSQLADRLASHVDALNARAPYLSEDEWNALPDLTDAENTPGTIANAFERAEAGELHPDDIAPLVDEAMTTSTGRHDLAEYAGDLRIQPGMDPDRLRWRAILALSRRNKEGGGRIAPEVRTEIRERKQAQRERADLYRQDEPLAIGKAAAGIPATRSEYESAFRQREDDPSLRRRIARRNRSGLPIDHPDHPDPEAAVLGHHLASRG